MIERYRIAQAKNLDTLDVLVDTGLLSKIPVDPFTGQAFVYRFHAYTQPKISGTPCYPFCSMRPVPFFSTFWTLMARMAPPYGSTMG
ncbi:MAG: hypothetical protein PHE53_08350 [Thermoguttaceae bacterium]|nr:hypothetical protein [Thermoguttaceae bacterium]